MSKGFEITQDNIDPVGHEPMKYRDGKWYLPGNELATPDFPIGPEEHNRQVFIEFERTFGRGFAYDVTHRSRQNSIYKAERERLDPEKERLIIQEYVNLKGNTVFFSDEKMSIEMIEALKRFRMNHPELYAETLSSIDPEEIFKILS